MILLQKLLWLVGGLSILQPSMTQKWKEMEIAQQQLSLYLNSTKSPLHELAAESTPNRSPSLECMIFGHQGCNFVCDLRCLMYGCVCAGICEPSSTQDTCECRESYHIGDSYISSEFFQFLPLADLWNYRFERNIASIVVTNYIKQDLKTTLAIGSLLRDPRITGTQIKFKLMRMFPETTPWLLNHLKPIIRGKIDTFLNPRRHFDYATFTRYLNQYLKAKYAEIEHIEIRNSIQIEKYLEDKENIKFVARQLLLFPSKDMIEVMDTFSAITGISYEKFTNKTDIDLFTSQHPNHQLIPQQIDEIIKAGAFSQLLQFKAIPRSIDDHKEKQN